MSSGRYTFSTRDDPHAQARAARSQPLLLHSLQLFREIFAVIYRTRDIHTVIEIGVESGMASALHLQLGASAVYGVDPHPDGDVRARFAAMDGMHLIEQTSPQALEELPIGDLYVVDGDHNYSVVHREISWILSHAPNAVVVTHDVLWPWARRDLYYEPSPLAADDRHDPTDDGPTVWHDEVTPAGFVGASTFMAASHAGGERNGVLTAIEDGLSSTDEDWEFEIVPAVFGLGILFRTGDARSDTMSRALAVYTESNLLAALENNRIALYTQVLQLQYEAAAHTRDSDQLAETVQSQAQQIATLQAALESERASAARARDVAQAASSSTLSANNTSPHASAHPASAAASFLRGRLHFVLKER